MEDQKIVELTDVKHARLRTEMYLGGRTPDTAIFPHVEITGFLSFKEFTFVPSVLTAFREAFDNALDEMSFVGKGEIEVMYDEETRYFGIRDSGRGIPIDYREDSGMHTATLAVSKTKAGRNFTSRGEVSGTNGLGISIVNFVSDEFTLSINRDKKFFRQEFEVVNDGNDLSYSVPSITASDSKTTGTTVSFRLSEEVFHHGVILPVDMVRSIVTLVAYSNPNIKFTFNGVGIKVQGKTVKDAIFGKSSQAIEIPFSKDDVGNGIFLVRKTSGTSSQATFVNNVPAYNGGTHLDEFRNHFQKNLLEALKKESKRRRLNPTKSDVLDAVDIIGFVKMKGPNFDSQSKTRLTNVEIRNPIFHSFASVDWDKVVKSNKDIIEEIYRLCSIRSGQKDKGQIDQNEKALKKAKIAKLVDANSRIRSDCTLFLAEGDSAAGGLAAVRDPNIHAVMPLRGKIKNVHGLSPSEAIGEKESVIKDMCAAIGLVPGKKADKANLRYSSVMITCDADDDGIGSICPLLVNFFQRFWPELFEGTPFIKIFLTPLIILTKGKERKYFYPTDIEDFVPSEWKGWEVKRAKGLGSLRPENFKDHIANPIAIDVLEDEHESVRKLMSLLFQEKRADDRKTMLEIDLDAIMDRLKTMGTDWSPLGINEI
ncbi:DNA topoisomerase large subunit [Agrobacterium phage OLIVR5]|uniref:DNA topoisomerase 2 n=1 Tax=Agrobacterium phage OLIVR5 TaxID=2723773 RepID=A0A858MSN9_9CAUD|nr:DNA topoisomerase II [Agrobacterium phage OLIVR5]QIW87736.1 DNA topoisomerase large subunit [Agrobacterium phage OLIVR5]QIW87998.1 DNA topoisomerase large subunit [Agrobacterium phage OLIVR6]